MNIQKRSSKIRRKLLLLIRAPKKALANLLALESTNKKLINGKF